MAELGLAIVPLCLAAIKGSSVLGRKLPSVFRHSREIKRLRKKLKIETEIFKDECEFLLGELIEPMEAEAMVMDADHFMWTSEELDMKMKGHMRRRYPEICAVAQDIKGHIASLDADIESKYADLSQGNNVGSPRQHAVALYDSGKGD